jgi:hypothetical protein
VKAARPQGSSPAHAVGPKFEDPGPRAPVPPHAAVSSSVPKHEGVLYPLELYYDAARGVMVRGNKPQTMAAAERKSAKHAAIRAIQTAAD